MGKKINSFLNKMNSQLKNLSNTIKNMFRFFKNLIESEEPLEISCDSSEEEYERIVICCDECSESSSESESSEVSYDSDIDILLTKYASNRPYSPMDIKISNVVLLKRQLTCFESIPWGKKWYLVYALECIKKIGIFPPGMPCNKDDVLDMVKRYQRVLNDTDGINIAPYHKYLTGEDTSTKFELWAKSPVEKDRIYSMGKDENGQSLLHHAARWNNLKLAKVLLEKGFDPNLQDKEGRTPLFSCIGKLHHKGSKMPILLLKYGANPFHKLISGKSLLDKAIQKGNLNLIVLLVTQYGMDFGPRNRTFKQFPKWARIKLIKYWNP